MARPRRITKRYVAENFRASGRIPKHQIPETVEKYVKFLNADGTFSDAPYLISHTLDPKKDINNVGGRGANKVVVRGYAVIRSNDESAQVPEESILETLTLLGDEGVIQRHGPVYQSEDGELIERLFTPREELFRQAIASGQYQPRALQTNGTQLECLVGAISVSGFEQSRRIDLGKGRRPDREKRGAKATSYALHPNIAGPLFSIEVPQSHGLFSTWITFSEWAPYNILDISKEHLEKKVTRDVAELDYQTTTQWQVKALRDVAAGLEALHADDLVHRDMKPGNVVVTVDEDGYRALVTDLGSMGKADPSESTELSPRESEIQKIAAGFTATQDGQHAPNTPEYADPNRLHDNAFDRKKTNDIFSSAATDYTTLTGLLPFKIKDYERNPANLLVLAIRHDQIFPDFITSVPQVREKIRSGELSKEDEILLYDVSMVLATGLPSEERYRMNSMRKKKEDLDAILRGEQPKHTIEHIKKLPLVIERDGKKTDHTDSSFKVKLYEFLRLSYNKASIPENLNPYKKKPVPKPQPRPQPRRQVQRQQYREPAQKASSGWGCALAGVAIASALAVGGAMYSTNPTVKQYVDRTVAPFVEKLRGR